MDNFSVFFGFMFMFLTGILFGSFFVDGSVLKAFVVFIFSLCYLRAYVCVSSCDIFKYLLFFLAFSLGFGRFLYSIHEPLSYQGFVSFEACIVDEVDERSDMVKYVVKSEQFGNVLINAFPFPLYSYGDCLLIEGDILTPENFGDFQYDKYLSRYGIYKLINRPKIVKLSSKAPYSFFKLLYSLKSSFEMNLSEIFGEPHGSFMSGLILGSRRGIPSDLLDDFTKTGLTHIIAISGYNITLVVIFTSAFFGFLSRRVKVFVSVVFIVLFVLLVGAGAAVVRAALMGGIALIAVFFGRPYYTGISLLGAAFFMNLWNPQILPSDLGFQLSFLATCGIVYVSPLIEKYLMFLPRLFAIRESAILTLSAQIFALPIIVLNFNQLSVVSPFANVFVLPLIPFAMIFGFLAVLFSFVFSFLAYLFGFLGYL
ncbi:MAG: ComEC/Rec2 family competence protein, partial [bacterium]|nr:ComEC/Rec2 family competence protein [bacterium]